MKRIFFMSYDMPVVPFAINSDAPSKRIISNNQTAMNEIINKDSVAKKIYQGHGRSKNIQDLMGRAGHAFKIFQEAVKNILFGGPNILKIFAVPEFYFRRPETIYEQSEFYAFLDYYKTVSRDYPNVLFVLGTCWWGQKLTETKKAKVLYNSTCIVAEGDIVYTYLKQVPSGIDGFPGPDEEVYWTGDSNKFDMTYTKQSLESYNRMRRKLRKEGVETGVFSYNKIKFGIEVCRDHSLGVLKDEIGSKTVDVHLLVCCGNGLIAKNIKAKRGGLVLRCDGKGYGGTVWKADVRSQAVKVTNAASSKAAAQYETVNVYKRLPNSSLQGQISKNFKTYCSQKKMQGEGDCIVIFDAQL